MPLILASASPRRAELLTAAGFTFEVEPADVDETPAVGETPTGYALRVARDKARVVHGRRGRCADAILAADTVVVAGDRILAKPSNRWEARAMLSSLSGDVHEVLTAVVLIVGGREVADVVSSRVRFITLTDEEVDWYVGSGEPDGKAGGYAIQGRASRFIDWIEGSWSNVVGLPVATVYRIMKDAGVLC